MENLNSVDAFNWDAMKTQVGADPFAQTSKKFEEDTRFYKLAKDKAGNGAAVIRFLPDADRLTIQKVNKIGTTIVHNGKKRFVNEYSPSTINQPCPFVEKFYELFNAGNKEEAKNFGRSVRYIANIKVIKDPANPENEGKIFLFDMSQTLATKIQEILEPTPTQLALGKTAIQLFNPVKGHNFTLTSTKGSNGFINYDGSFPAQEVTSIYNSVEEAITDINTNTYKLSEFVQPEFFLSYEKLVEKLKWVMGEDTTPSTPAVTAITTSVTNATEIPAIQTIVEQVQPQVVPTQAVETLVTQAPAASNAPDLDALLNSLKM